MDELVAIFHERFLSRNWTLSTAESCTGGLLAALLAQRPGISSVFVGGCVTYSNFAKETLLGVPHYLLKSHGAVSSPVALDMARNVRKSLKSSWAVSTTGIAGPGGGSEEKPVGTVWFGVCGPGFVATEKKLIKGDRLSIQRQAAEWALRFLLESAK
jgi:PncC family amidohydrolase